jgi:hypothetical protein
MLRSMAWERAVLVVSFAITVLLFLAAAAGQVLSKISSGFIDETKLERVFTPLFFVAGFVGWFAIGSALVLVCHFVGWGLTLLRTGRQ